MIDRIARHIPDYMDDRLKVTVVLSDDLKYELRSLVHSNVVSSWYDPVQDRAFTTTSVDDVPEQYRSKLVQHSTSYGESTIMYPNVPAIKTIDTGLVVEFNRNPTFTGNEFFVWWDVKNKPDEYEVFSASDPISGHPHEYGSYGEYVIAFSSNVTTLNMNNIVAAQFNVYQSGSTYVQSPYFTTSTLEVKLQQVPYFEGDELSIWWDGNAYEPSIYTHESQLSDFSHVFLSYGEKNAITMKSSGNFVSADISKMLPDERGIAFIKKIESRNNAHTSIQSLSFCRILKDIDCQKLKSIATQWYDCYELTSIDLPELTSISRTYAVNCMPNWKRFYAPQLKRISSATSVFKGNVGLEKIVFPQLTSIYGGNGYTFMTNVSLSSAYCPKLQSCLKLDFAYCVNLKETNFSSLLNVPNGMFVDCISMKSISLPSIRSIAAQAFYRCQNLLEIDLSKCKQVPTLENANAFSGLPSSYKILVDESMLESFRAADVWNSSSVASHIFAK